MIGLVVPVERLPHAADLPLPAYATAGSSGLDLLAAVDVRLASLERALVPTGIRIGLPAGSEAQVRPRSGLALRHGVTVLNAPGTVDADYRGEVCVILVNLGREAVELPRGSRIAQLVVGPVTRIRWAEGDLGAATVRGSGGFGSTGTVA